MIGPLIFKQDDDKPDPTWSLGKYLVFEIAKAVAAAAATEGARWMFEEVRAWRKLQECRRPCRQCGSDGHIADNCADPIRRTAPLRCSVCNQILGTSLHIFEGGRPKHVDLTECFPNSGKGREA